MKTSEAQLKFTGGDAKDTITTWEMLEIEEKLVLDPAFKHSLMLWGPTGIGKSAIQRQLLSNHARRNGTPNWSPQSSTYCCASLEVYGDWGLIDKRLSTCDTTELQGIPALTGDYSQWKAPEDLPIVGQEHRFPPKGIFFLDELTLASPPLQAIGYSIVLDHRAGPHRLLPGWKVLAASNLLSEKAYTYDLGHPLKNRFLHYALRCDLAAFKKWAHDASIDPRIICFLTFDGTYLHADSDPTAKSFPTPRSWEFASNILKRFSNGQLMRHLQAAVGPEVAVHFKSFLDVYDSDTRGDYKDMDDVLRGNVKPAPIPSGDQARAYATAARLLFHLRNKPQDAARVMAFLRSAVWAHVGEIRNSIVTEVEGLTVNS